MPEFAIESTVSATPDTVFGVYTDHRRYADLAKLIRRAELEREGDPPPNGLGAIRKLHLPGVSVREQVTEFERPRCYSYRMLSGLPLDEYTAAVTFTPIERSTKVGYRVSVVGSIRGLPVKYPTEEFVRVFMRAADAEAEAPETPRRPSSSVAAFLGQLLLSIGQRALEGLDVAPLASPTAFCTARVTADLTLSASERGKATIRPAPPIGIVSPACCLILSAPLW